MTAPVLFVDIDGVLLPGRRHNSPANMAAHAGQSPDLPWSHLIGGLARVCATECCPAAIDALNGVLDRTGAQTVLISTWRNFIGEVETREILHIQGVRDAWHADWSAPWTGRKGDDIEAWLGRHPETTIWAVMDDDMIWPAEADEHRAMCARHVRPDFDAGPTDEEWQRLEELLRERNG